MAVLFTLAVACSGVAQDVDDLPPWQRMDYGPALHWTYEVADENIAYKGIAVRLDPGDGGVSMGEAWMVYDHDTMRVAAAWSRAGDEPGFIDWKGVAFDGSHNTHPRIVGDVAFVHPVGPGWAEPGTGSFEDPRLRGRDGKPYGPLPRDWAQYLGRYAAGDRVVLEYSVGGTRILECPGLEPVGRGALGTAVSSPVFARTLDVAASAQDLLLRVAPTSVAAAVVGRDALELVEREGHHLLRIPAAATPVRLRLLVGALDPAELQAVARNARPPEGLGELTVGGTATWPEILETESRLRSDDGPFSVDGFAAPDGEANPWRSWLRFGGFDFLPGGDRVAIATWNGDVWEVQGIDGEARTLRWRRIAAGLFQPLGVVVVDGAVYVSCRDQIVVLEDVDGDGETDRYRCFNSDHQVTEHFHEFAMGLQTDADGNFYYAKSARHAKKALVPHHGTLLKVSADGSRTEIVANGFRAANGVCVNGDGSFFVTDQEGHWTPKNRINRVVPGGFYGNMMGYHDQASSADDAMEPPLCWITNGFDRSPGELVRVPEGCWGALGGQLLQISYGVGQIFAVLEDRVGGVDQGGMVALPLPPFPTGVMRGRFHPDSGHLYTCGLFGWSGARTEPGGFFRVRRGSKPLRLPLAMRARGTAIELDFAEPLLPEIAADPESYAIKTWSLERSGGYGSKHIDERARDVSEAFLSDDGRTVRLVIPDMAPTMGLEIRGNLDTLDEVGFRFKIHGTIHALR